MRRRQGASGGTSLPELGLYCAKPLGPHGRFGLEPSLSLFGDAQQGHPPGPDRLKPITIIAALGIVYGDIGTSPLYVFQAIAKINHGHFDELSALGSLSLIFWTLIIIVSVKYALVVMRADNHGEGGILALMSLTRAKWHGRNSYLIACGLIGAALLYGDGMITPAISVLSAVEGLKLASQDFARYTMPIAAVVLLMLFLLQRYGTAVVGRIFGPAMLLWFLVIAILGAIGIGRAPHVIVAVSPLYAVSFLIHHGVASFAILGAVFLCVTGAEAMYADMGHLGREPIRIAWTAIVLPALLLNYAGQTAVVLQNSGSDANPFFVLAPDWLLYPMIVLSTFATVIASQAIITGSFSLTRQAMQLGWLPGMHINQTSSEQYGQIYVPFVNWLMMLGTLALTVIFASSDRLAGAYGAAVSTTMLMTTAILYRIMRVSWRWPAWAAIGVFSLFLTVDIAFFAANTLKIAEGGWIPLVVGGLLFAVMTTWRAGMDAMHRTHVRETVTIAQFVRRLHDHKIERVPGRAIFLTRLRGSIPPLIADHVRQFGSLYQEAIALSVSFSIRPRVRAGNRLHVEKLGEGFWHVTVRFGFVEVPNVAKALHLEKSKCPIDPDDAIYFSEHDSVVARKGKPRLAAWRRRLFSFLSRNSIHPADRFNIPAENFVQISRQIEV
jgi:KUP system potassium uptake protein